jgi:hypothetical protein
MKNILLIFLFTSILYSCENINLHDERIVIVYSGGNEIGRWVSTGKVQWHQKDNYHYFKDKKCGCIVGVTGDMVILETHK